jgi:hypothetical protein
MNRDEIEAVFDGSLPCRINGINRHEHRPIGAMEHEDGLAMSTAASDVDHLTHAEMP